MEYSVLLVISLATILCADVSARLSQRKHPGFAATGPRIENVRFVREN